MLIVIAYSLVFIGKENIINISMSWVLLHILLTAHVTNTLWRVNLAIPTKDYYSPPTKSWRDCFPTSYNYFAIGECRIRYIVVSGYHLKYKSKQFISRKKTY